MVRDNVRHRRMKLSPVRLTLFIFVLTLNLLGMVPSPSP